MKKLEKFVVLVWYLDEGGMYSPVSFPVHATSDKEIKNAIKDGKDKLNGFHLPDTYVMEGDMPKSKGKIYTLDKWSNLKLKPMF